MCWGRKWVVDFDARKTQVASFDLSNTTGAIDVKILGLFLRKIRLLKWYGCLSLLN